MIQYNTGGLNVEGEADSWDFGVGMYLSLLFVVVTILFTMLN